MAPELTIMATSIYVYSISYIQGTASATSKQGFKEEKQTSKQKNQSLSSVIGYYLYPFPLP